MNSPNALSALARLLAILFAVLFVATAVIALALFNIERGALDPLVYQRALTRARFYQRVPAVVGGLLARNLGESAPTFMRRITAEQWGTVIETLLPEAQLRLVGEEATEQVLGYINGDVSLPSLSLLPLKQSLAGPRGLAAITILIQSQPPCTPQQIANLAMTLGQELCNPPQEMLDMLRPILQEQLQSAAAAIPDNVPLMTSKGQEALLQRLNTARLIMRLSPLLPLVLLFGITLLAVRSLQGWLTWWGWPFLLAGLLVAIFGFSGTPLLRLFLERRFVQQFASRLPPAALALIRDAGNAILRQILAPVGWEGLALAVIGLAMIIASYVVAWRERQARLARSEAETRVF